MDAPVLMDIDQHAALPFPQSLPEFQRLSLTIVPALITRNARWETFRLSALWCDWRTFRIGPPGRAGMPQMPTSDRTDCRHGHGAQPHAVVHLVLAAYLVATQTPECPLSSSNATRALALRDSLSDPAQTPRRNGPPAQDRIGWRANEHVEVDETWLAVGHEAKAEAFTTRSCRLRC